MKNCRIDYKYLAGSNWSILVDYLTDNVLYISAGTHTLKDMYSDFKFSVKTQLPIDNYYYSSLPKITKIEGAIYAY